MDDLISRQDAIYALLEKGQRSRRYKLGEIWELNFDEIREALATVQSAEPVKHGKWEMKPDLFGFFDEIPVCSKCGCTTKMREKTKYCPNCGARMDEE